MNKLVKYLVDEEYLKTPEIIRAFELIDRAKFLGSKYQGEAAYQDIAVTLDSGEAVFHPSTVAQMIELLEPKPGDKVLEIGIGSGWQTAIIACIASNFSTFKNQIESAGELPNDGDKIISKQADFSLGGIVSLGRYKVIIEQAERNLNEYGFVRDGIARVVRRDIVFGYSKEAPYDKIISNACPNMIPRKWKENLKVGGKLVTPFGQSLLVLEKTGKDTFKKSSYFGFTFPMTVFS